jgi:hypothetical protein
MLWTRLASKISRRRCTGYRGYSDPPKPNAGRTNNENKKSLSKTLRPFAIFAMGMYLGLAFFKNPSGQKREGSKYLKDLKNDFDRTSGVLPPSNDTGLQNEYYSAVPPKK